MIATLVSALAVALCASLSGQLVCALCGARRWTAAAPAVGLSLLLLIAAPGPHLPGRMTLPFLATVALTLGGLALMVRRGDHRPPLGAAPAAVLTLLVTLLPFYASGRFGVLGVGFQNDMAAHLLYAGSYRDAALESSAPFLDYYPFGPHAFVAELGHGTGFGLDGVFTGLTIAMPVLTSLTVFTLLRRVGWLPAVLASIAASMSYLSAAWVGEGAFKEVMLPLLLLGAVGLLIALREDELRGPWRLVGLGLITGGVLSTYSIPGLAWLVGTVGLATVVVIATRLRRDGVSSVLDGAQTFLAPVVLGGLILVVVMIPQLPRVHAFWRYMHNTGTGTGIAKDDLGNLAGPLRFLESTGMWLSADFRFPPLAEGVSTVFAVIVLAAAAWGAARLLLRGEPELVSAAAVCLLIAAFSAHSQSPYTTAKAFVIAAPFLLTLASIGLLEQRPDPAALRLGRFAVAIAVLCVGSVSSFLVLRFLPVGPRTHEQQLAKFRPLVQGKRVLMTLNDEYGQWYLSGALVTQPLFPATRRDLGAVPVLPVKDAGLGHAYDWDSFGNLDRFDDVVMVRDPSASQAPTNFRLVASSGPFDLYARTGPGKLRGVLSSERADAGQRLVCASPEGKAVLRGGGVAGVRKAPVRVMSPVTPQGTTAPIPVTLTPGRWKVNVAYNWYGSVRIQGPGLDTTLPASLDRVGSRYPAGEVRVTGTGPVTIRLTPKATRLHRPGLATAAELSFTPEAAERTVPVKQACGKYLDWYEPQAG